MEGPKQEQTFICPECDGTGRIDYDHEDEKGKGWEVDFTCPVCEGDPNWTREDWAEFCETGDNAEYWSDEDLITPSRRGA